MSSRLSLDIKQQALSLGFSACGIAPAECVDDTYAQAFLRAQKRHLFADMGYMYEHTDMRLNPRKLMPKVKSIISLAMSYAPERRISPQEFQIAAYALGKDYHEVLREKMWQLVAACGLGTPVKSLPSQERPPLEEATVRCFCDTAPVIERYWAYRAGLGWIGKSHQLIIPHAGSWFFLCEIFTDKTLDYDNPMPSRCGNCTRCIDTCPGKAIRQVNDLYTDGRSTDLDCQRCLSYQTIENRHELSADAVHNIGNHIYGCDECQLACPWNRFAKPTQQAQFKPSESLMNMRKEDWQRLTEQQYRQLFKGSAVKRAKYSGLMRNIQAATKNDASHKEEPSL